MCTLYNCVLLTPQELQQIKGGVGLTVDKANENEVFYLSCCLAKNFRLFILVNQKEGLPNASIYK
ncbi:hypothetical protein LX64_05142 [Chitinophaga skermanii]|uniref:Uncharacterized protein n=1 Tax=Chitinophaga skermanii TaxID=331697 RepID=A0A327Q173_9BACT|nr:hypothetical protein LX64_05142 [Chitinophaga skermanii]